MNLKLGISILALILVIPGIVQAYDDQTTHPALTDEIVDYYNSFGSIKISPEEKEWIVAGSILEDVPPRWINHFYDPINKVGWTGDNTGLISAEIVQFFSRIGLSIEKPISALDWMGNYLIQQEYTPYGGNHSWQKGLEEYAGGDKRAAFITLGHLLHLLEDLSVPDHTRNDTHAHALEGVTGDPGSPYEGYAVRWNRSSIKELKIASSLNSPPLKLSRPSDYLVSLAEYSNKYFFSKDTIHKYELPLIIRLDRYLAYGNDDKGIEFPLARHLSDKANGSIDVKYVLESEDIAILEGYFSRLSRQAVIHGGGLVDLFIREAENEKENQQFRVTSRDAMSKIARSSILPTFSLVGLIAKTQSAAQLIVDRSLGLAKATLTAFMSPFIRENQTQVTNETEEPDLTIPQPSSTPPSELSKTVLEPIDKVAESPEIVLPEELFKVARVIDGESIQLDNGKIVKYIGIEAPDLVAPEPGCMALEAKKKNEELVLGKEIFLEPGPRDRDEAGRLLRYVWSGTEHLNYQMVRSGLASEFEDFTHAYQKEFDRAEKLAFTEKIGIWSPACAQKEILPPALAQLKCAYATNRTPLRNKVILNEVAWMGNVLSADDEWIELKNLSAHPVNISDWQLVDQSEQIRFRLKEGTTLASGGFYLLERTRDDTVPGISADAIYAGVLSNHSEGLRLFDAECSLMDEVIAYSTWPAGEADEKRTMERRSDLSWQTYGGESPQGILGTPKRENSPGFQQRFSSQTPSAPPRVLISEIQTRTADSAGDEFIELYNPSPSPADISNWSIQYLGGAASTTQKKTLPAGHSIPANGYYLIARSGAGGYDGSRAADLTYASFSLSSVGGTVFLVRNDQLVEGVGDSDVADRLAYGDGTLYPEGTAPDAPPAGSSLERKSSTCVSSDEFSGNGCETDDNSSDFALRPLANPQNSESLPEPRSAPSIPSFLASFASSTMQIDFDWVASDALGSVSGISYALKRIDDPSTLIEGTSTNFTFPSREIGLTYEFELAATDRDGLSAFATTSVPVQSFLKNLLFYPGLANHTLELQYTASKFIRDPSASPAWQALVFYLDREPNASNTLLTTSGGHAPADADGVLAVLRASCMSSAPGSSNAYVFATDPSACGSGGGLKSDASPPLPTEDGRAYISTAATLSSLSLTPDNFLTVAFYDFSDSGGGSQELSLVARDLTKYHYSLVRPSSDPPTPPGPLSVNYDETNSTISFSWSSSTDPDTPDSLLTYEVAVTTSSIPDDADWRSVGAALTASSPVTYPESYNLFARAKDDVGNVSAAQESAWTFSRAPLPFFSGNSEFIGWAPQGQRILLHDALTVTGLYFWTAPSTGFYNRSDSYTELRADADGAPGDVLTSSSIMGVDHNDLARERLYEIPATELSPGYYWIFVQPNPSLNGTRIYGGPDGYADGRAEDPSKDLYFRLRKQ